MPTNIPSGAQNLNDMFGQIISNQTCVTPQEEADFIFENMPDHEFTQAEADFLRPYYKGEMRITKRPRNNKFLYLFTRLFFFILILLIIAAAV